MRLVRVHSTLAARSSAVCSALSCSHAATLYFLSLLGRDNLLLPGQLVYSSCTRFHRRSLCGRDYLHSEQGTPQPGQRRSLLSLVGWCNPYQMERTKLIAPGKHRHTLIYGLGGFRVEPVFPKVRFSPLSVLSGCTLFPHERTVYTSTLSINFLSSRTYIEVYIKCKRSR